MSKEEIVVYTYQGEKHRYPYPWSFDEIAKVSHEGGKLAEFRGFPDVNAHICDVKALEGLLPMFIKIRHYIHNTEFDVVYSDSEMNAVRQMFQNNLPFAVYLVFGLKDEPEEKVNFFVSKSSWRDVLEQMKATDKFISLGADYFAGFTLERG